ncbi:MAG: 16S rRNA (guanine(527)-N(7))-methyltransferase RsmG [Candidatus Cloacimonetes bacterium]|nr:16S rRNA (guanine(527)-N(7))-methyltransferase RsmG [Candidatus Cloacimonadota bacterium]
MSKLLFSQELLKITSSPKIIESFQYYLDLLWTENAKINLISRKTEKEKYWTKHFLDSIMPAFYYDFSGKKILDFGTGGGLPGIPVKLCSPDSELTLLDSTLKKIKAVENISKKLDLKNCKSIWSRLEDIEMNKLKGKFDYILCRSVKILPEYKRILTQLINNDGKLILYKGNDLSDVQQFNNKEIIDVSREELGTRKLVIIHK